MPRCSPGGVKTLCLGHSCEWARHLLLILLEVLCVVGSSAAETLLENYATLPTADTTVNVSCRNIVLSNVTVQGNMTLNISIAGMIMANPTSAISVTIVNMTVDRGGTLVFDSRGFTSATDVGGMSPLSIMIQTLNGNDGCLVFLGCFPPGTTSSSLAPK